MKNNEIEPNDDLLSEIEKDPYLKKIRVIDMFLSCVISNINAVYEVFK